ncbi:MAG: hypothetical protein R3A46_11150 [Thermomicrobiales bacterium]
MSKRGWIIVSIAGGVVVGLIGAAAGFGAYIHRARKAAAATAREAFDPYYSLVQYLWSVDSSEPGPDQT